MNNIKHTQANKCSHRYLLQKLTINKQYKNITNKSCCIPSLLKPYEVSKKRVKHKVLIAENDPASLTRTHLNQKDTSHPVAWHNWSWNTRARSLSQQHYAIDHKTRKIQWHFTTIAAVMLLLAIFFLFAHRLQQHTGSLYGGWRRRSCLFLSQINPFASEDLEY